MKLGKKVLVEKDLNTVGGACFLVNGIIFIFYAVLVPAYVHSVHGLITLAAVLYLFAIPSLYYALHRVHQVGSKGVALLFGVSMLILILSDLLLVSSSITALSHAIAYVAGNLLFLIGVLIAGALMLKGVFYRWVAYLSIIVGIVGLATYFPQAAGSTAWVSLLLLGVWSLAVGFNIRKLVK
jgi:hypothetical protein